MNTLLMPEFRRRGFKPLFEDQFTSMPPRLFPDVLEWHTIPPVKDKLVGQTTTPLYLLGWFITPAEFRRRYSSRCGATELTSIRERLRKLWVQHIGATNQRDIDYESYAPDIAPKDFQSTYILFILGNHDERTLRLSLVDEAVKAVMGFLEIDHEDQPKWIRL